VILEAIVSIVGIIAFMIIPGIIWSYVFFPKKVSKLTDSTDGDFALSITIRLVISACLSLALVSLSIFYLDYLLGLRPSTLTALISIAATSLLGMVILSFTSPGVVRRCTVTMLQAIKRVTRGIQSLMDRHH
jgi:hypothetical protein